MTRRTLLAVAVLAGGEGRRIGGGKPLVRLAGATLLERAYRRAAGWAELATVVLRAPGQIGDLALPWIADKAGIEGPLAGLAAGLAWAGEHGAPLLLTIPCDMPFLPADLDERLASAIGDARAAVASSGGHLHPVCAAWRTSAEKELAGYCRSGRRSLKGFAEHVGMTVVEWPVSPFDPFFNINGPAELEAAAAMLP